MILAHSITVWKTHAFAVRVQAHKIVISSVFPSTADAPNIREYVRELSWKHSCFLYRICRSVCDGNCFVVRSNALRRRLDICFCRSCSPLDFFCSWCAFFRRRRRRRRRRLPCSLYLVVFVFVHRDFWVLGGLPLAFVLQSRRAVVSFSRWWLHPLCRLRRRLRRVSPWTFSLFSPASAPPPPPPPLSVLVCVVVCVVNTCLRRVFSLKFFSKNVCVKSKSSSSSSVFGVFIF